MVQVVIKRRGKHVTVLSGVGMAGRVESLSAGNADEAVRKGKLWVVCGMRCLQGVVVVTSASRGVRANAGGLQFAVRGGQRSQKVMAAEEGGTGGSWTLCLEDVSEAQMKDRQIR